MKGFVRVGGTVVLTGLAFAYILWTVDLEQTGEVLLDADPWWFALAVVIVFASAAPLALRWQWLMSARGMPDSFSWLTRAYFVSYTAGQVLPTAIGGDAVRIWETTRRHPGRVADIIGIVLLERGLGGAGTVLLGGIGFLLAIGRYDVGAYLWLELACVVGTALVAYVFFSRAARPCLARFRPLLRRFRLERTLRAFYDSIHHFRGHHLLLWKIFAFTFVLLVVRMLAIWACARAVGIDLGLLVYFVMGPLLLLVLLVPFTLNGIGVREAFFVSFLGNVGVTPEAALAAGLLFFFALLALAVPGGAILAWEGMRGGARQHTTL